jgi:hypothetical protein
VFKSFLWKRTSSISHYAFKLHEADGDAALRYLSKQVVYVGGTCLEVMEATMAERPDPRRVDHREARRLSWRSRHIPWGTLLLGGLMVVAVLSAIYTVIAQGPSNPIP